ncbi:MAG: hypothetical protein H6R05_701 [Burkholderiaceae bacterium]|nr:hypothetical protein [Burkholderiaceae bacterium]
MMSFKPTSPLRTQTGFTLLELLFAMAIVLVVVVAAQRYVAGVLTDREHLSAQQDQTNQVDVVLSNMQNDVARAGFIPVASVPSFTEVDVNNAGVTVRPCTSSHCEDNELLTSYWTNEKIAYDCVHNEVKTTRTSGWVRVENVYRFQKMNGVWVLGCDGNGGNGGWEGLTNPTEGDIEDFNWVLDSNAAVNGAKLLHFCVTTRTAKNNQVTGGSHPKSCKTTGESLSNDGAWVYQTIELDMLVRPSQVGVAP